MKKIILSTLLAGAILAGNAQVVIDTVAVGASYANQKWYSLQNDEQGSAPKNNWDIAFDASGFGASILINSVTGTTLWGYPGGDTSKWSTLDTTGITTWMKRWNSDTSWVDGAFNRYANASNPVDLDWGIYSTITHFVTGDSLYVIKLASGTYKKLWIQQLASGTFTFRYANLSGTSDTTVLFAKSTYTNKNFGYYSLQNNIALDREPVNTSWDLVFGQYTAFIPSPYTVTGILHNNGVRVAQVDTVGNATTYNNWSVHTFIPAINEIGYDWKTFNGSAYVIEDSLLYFVKTKSGDIWKIIPTGFGGSSTGNHIFSKEKLSSVGIADANGNSLASLAIYPNPSNGEAVTIVYNFETNNSSVKLTVYDLSGRTVYADVLNNQIGLHQYQLSANNLNTGMYFVTIDAGESRLQQKLIIK